MSPELIDPMGFGVEGKRPTKMSDCYAFGMVIYEVGVSVDDLMLQVLKMRTGIMRSCPISQYATGTSDHDGNLGRDPTGETGERDGSRIYRGIMGNCRKVLGGRLERTTGRGRYSFLFGRDSVALQVTPGISEYMEPLNEGLFVSFLRLRIPWPAASGKALIGDCLGTKCKNPSFTLCHVNSRWLGHFMVKY